MISMKSWVIAALILMSSTVAFGATTGSKPDYSRKAILLVLHDRDREQAPFQLDVGMLEVNTRSTRYHVAYLPLLAPLPYSYPRQTLEMPNPFVLTGTEFPYVPRH